MRTHFSVKARALQLTARERQVVIGTVLGDGYLMSTTAGHCLRLNHGIQQRAYVDWKYRELRRFVRTPPRASGNAYYFRTVSHPLLTIYRNVFYVNANKVLPIGFLTRELQALGLAVWFMDDGSADRNQLRLNTQSFCCSELREFIGLLLGKFGVRATLNRDKRHYRLRIGSQSMQQLRQLISEYFHPSM